MVAPPPFAAAQRQAQALRDAGDLQSARDLLRRILDSDQPVHGADHPETLAAAHLLARLDRESHDPAAARRTLEAALDAGQRRLGEDHPLILAMSFDLGCVTEELGNRHEARRNFRRVADAGPAVLGEDHWSVRAAREYLDRASPAFPEPTAPDLAGGPTPAYQPALPYQPVPAYGSEGASAPSGPAATRGRGPLLVAVIAAGVAVAAAVVVLVVVLAGAAGPRWKASDALNPGPTLHGQPPTGVTLRDGGADVTVKWTDPTAGTVPFIVAGGQAGQTLAPFATISPGRTSYTVHGLNPQLDYCFTVLAVYSTDQYATSGQICTTRTATASPN